MPDYMEPCCVHWQPETMCEPFRAILAPHMVSIIRNALLQYSSRLHEQFGEEFEPCLQAKEAHALWAKFAPAALTIEGKLHPLADKEL